MPLNNVPLPGQNLLETRGPIQQNFATIDTVLAVDHSTYNTVEQGKHLKVTFPNRAGILPIIPDTPAFLATEYGLYNAPESALPNTLQLWIHNAATGFDTPMTKSIFDVVPAPVSLSSGYTWLPSGLVMQWGSFNSPNNTVINFPIPFDNVCLQVMTGNYTAATPNVGAATLTINNFTLVTSPAANAEGTYIALGY